MSTSGPFIVLARMDAFTIVLLRSAGAAIVLFGYAFVRGLPLAPGRHRAALVAGAALLAAHFLLWVKAFDLTDYASNLLLLVAQPVMAAVLGIRLGDPPTRWVWIAVALAAVGLAAIAGGDLRLGPRALVGDAMCVVGGLCIASFYVVTRGARAELPLVTFLAWTLAATALFAAPAVLVAGARVAGYAPRSWLWLAALVLVTTIGGHGLLNLAARHLKLFSVNLVIVLEPAIGIALGAALFGARVTLVQALGGLVLATAVVVGLRH